MSDLEVRKRTWMWIVSVITGLLFGLGLLWGNPAHAKKEKRVVEEISDIRIANTQIIEQQYEHLMEKARKEELEVSDFEAFWDNGVGVRSRDGKHKVKIGGRIHLDWAGISADDEMKEAYPDLEGNGFEFRRARLFVKGTLWDILQFESELDFAGGEVNFKDLWMGLRHVPYIGNIRVGHQKEPFSLEELTSGNCTTFMERGLPNVFAPGRNTGLMLRNTHLDDRIWWGIGVFKETDDSGDMFSNQSDYNVTARVTGVPWVEEKKLLHLGLSYTHQFRSGADNPIRYRQRPEAHITDEKLVDTGSMPVDGVDILNPELAFVYAPFSLQSEYFYAFVNPAGGEILDGEAEPFPDDNLGFQGFYAYFSYFFTGESRPYKEGDFSRVKPLRDFNFFKGGWGAWEGAFRFSYLDLDDRIIDGGKERNYTVGLNWYLNPNLRWMFNYVRADVDAHGDLEDDSSANIAETRFAIDY